MKPIIVMAGTPVDTRMGMDCLSSHGLTGLFCPVSENPNQQTAFQISPMEKKAAAVTALLWWFDTASYDKLCLMMFSGMTFCLIIYMVLPNGLDIRPTAEAIGRENFAMTLMQLIWKADASVNVCPSIHCQSSGCMALAFSQSRLAKGRPGLKVLAWVWAALICASTVFTKQHSILDVVCGLVLVAVWVPFLYGKKTKIAD